MSYRTVISIFAATIFGIACVSTDAFAFRGGRVGAVGVHAGVYRGGIYRGGYARRGWGVGAAAVGAAVAAPYYNSTQCGYAPFPPCY
jgi:hypothetical protein